MNRFRTIRLAVQALLLALIPATLPAGTQERWFQFGLFPPLSSNGINSGKTVNTVSLNLLGGYSAANRVFELGGVWNASREYTQGVQIAGLLNYTGNSRNAVQVSGMANIARAGNSPLQIGGLVNVAGHVNGLQLSGLVNVAKSVSGVQIGLVNYMADGSKGISIGLLNIARRGGKYEVEVSFSEALNTLVSFRMGTDRFYTIFSGGVNYFFAPLEYAVGLGFGTSIGWTPRWGNQIELQAFGVSRERKLTNSSINGILQLRLPVTYRVAKHFKVFAGPALNVGLQNADAGDTVSLAPWTMWQGETRGLLVSSWVGLSAGFRF